MGSDGRSSVCLEEFICGATGGELLEFIAPDSCLILVLAWHALAPTLRQRGLGTRVWAACTVPLFTILLVVLAQVRATFFILLDLAPVPKLIGWAPDLT